MKVLITGGNGYIAKSIAPSLSLHHDVTVVTRADFDISNPDETRSWFDRRAFDAVIHTAAIGGSRLSSDSDQVLEQNLKMHYNLLACKQNFDRLIVFGSGAEIFAPDTQYGLSKKVIANSVNQNDNCYSIRIFAVFDENELPTRFIRANISRYLRNEPMQIHKNKVMDFFYMQDLIQVVDKYLTEDNLPKEIDCTYREKHTLTEIADSINRLGSYKVSINVQQSGMSFYSGQPLEIDIPLVGFSQGLANTFRALSTNQGTTS